MYRARPTSIPLERRTAAWVVLALRPASRSAFCGDQPFPGPGGATRTTPESHRYPLKAYGTSGPLPRGSSRRCSGHATGRTWPPPSSNDPRLYRRPMAATQVKERSSTLPMAMQTRKMPRRFLVPIRGETAHRLEFEKYGPRRMECPRFLAFLSEVLGRTHKR